MLSGLFCCLGFLGVFCCLGRGAFSLFFAVWAGARAPPKQQEKTRPAPSERVVGFFFAVWAGGVFIFCCLGGGGGREFTHLPVCLACLQATQQQKRPNSKNKNTGSISIQAHPEASINSQRTPGLSSEGVAQEKENPVNLRRRVR